MASTKIDELQLQIGSDASGAIKQLSSLSNALNKAADAASKLSSATGSLNGFTDSVTKVAETDFTTAIGNLRKLNRTLNKIKDKNVSVKVDVTGAQGLGNLTNAGKSTSKAINSIGSSNSTFGTSIGSASNVATSGLKKLLRASLDLGGKGASALGSFMSKAGLIPSFASGVDRTAISFGNLLRAIVPFLSIRSIFGWLKDSINIGSSLVEIENVIDTAFGDLKKGYEDASGYVYKWAKGTLDAFGVSELAAKQYAGRLMSMFNSSGFDVTEGMRNSAAKMTTDLIERAGDVASFYDITVDEAMTKFQAGLAGQVRPLRALGVNMSVANLQAFALSQGINTAWKEMDQASQMALRYQYILNATQYAMGDFQRTSGTFANQVRLLSLNFQVLGSTIGQGLISAIAPAISWLNALIRRLIAAANAFRAFMFTLFGKAVGAAKGTVNDMAGYLDDASDAVGGLGGGAGDASDGLGKAGKAAKELKKQLTVLPFDELNQLAKDTNTASSGGSGGSGGGGGGGGVGGLGDLGLTDVGEIEIDSSPVAQAIDRWAARIREAFQKRQWKNLGRIVAEGINSGFGYIYDILDWNKIKPRVVDGFIVPFQTAFNSMMDWIDWKKIGKTFSRGLNDIAYTLRAWITGFHWRDYGTYFADGLNAMVGDIDADALGRLIADKFKMAWDFFGGWVRRFDFSNLGTQLKNLLNGAIDELDPQDMGSSLAELLNGISDTIIAFLEDGTVRSNVSKAFVDFVNGFIKDFDADDAYKALTLVKDTIVGGLGKALAEIDVAELGDKLATSLSGLPWLEIAAVIGAKAGASLALGIFGTAFKLKAASIISGISVGGGATSGAAGAASGVASGVGGTIAGLTVSQLAIVGGVSVGGIALGLWLKKQADESGLTKLFQIDTKGNKQKAAKETAEGARKNQQALDKAGINGAGYSTRINTQSLTPAPATQNATDVVQKITTVLFGQKDPSFTNLETAKAGLLENPIVKKIMDGATSKSFDVGYKKFTDVNPYQAIKKFGANVSNDMKTWYARLLDTKPYRAVKKFDANPTQTLKTWWTRYTDTKAYQSVKKFGASISSTLKTWWGRYTDTSSYQAIKKFGADISNTFKTWWSKFTDRSDYPATKTLNAKDGGKFIALTDRWRNIHDKWVDINVSIVKKTSDLGAWIKGKWEELVKFDWFAGGGMFTGPVGIKVFGEAGDEAAIPLERKSTMKRIGNAIVSAGGMNTGTNGELADEIAARIAPIVVNAVASQSQRPVNVNATLYTENNEVLARAVNKGNRSLDKRYNPVAQYGY